MRNLSTPLRFTVPSPPNTEKLYARLFAAAPALAGTNGDVVTAGGAGDVSSAVAVPANSCMFWDEKILAYSAEGCGSLPDPLPPGVAAEWVMPRAGGRAFDPAVDWVLMGGARANPPEAGTRRCNHPASRRLSFAFPQLFRPLFRQLVRRCLHADRARLPSRRGRRKWIGTLLRRPLFCHPRPDPAPPVARRRLRKRQWGAATAPRCVCGCPVPSLGGPRVQVEPRASTVPGAQSDADTPPRMFRHSRPRVTADPAAWRGEGTPLLPAPRGCYRVARRSCASPSRPPSSTGPRLRLRRHARVRLRALNGLDGVRGYPPPRGRHPPAVRRDPARPPAQGAGPRRHPRLPLRRYAAARRAHGGRGPLGAVRGGPEAESNGACRRSLCSAPGGARVHPEQRRRLVREIARVRTESDLVCPRSFSPCRCDALRCEDRAKLISSACPPDATSPAGCGRSLPCPCWRLDRPSPARWWSSPAQSASHSAASAPPFPSLSSGAPSTQLWGSCRKQEQKERWR